MAQQHKISSDKAPFAAKVIEMWRKEHGCDVTIICKDEKTTKAHSIVLRSVSERIDQLLDSTTEDVIMSEDVSVNTWKSLLEIVYTGAFNTSMDNDDLQSVRQLAQAFDMETLVEQIENYKELSDSNIGSHLYDSTQTEKVENSMGIDSDVKKEELSGRKPNKSSKKKSKRGRSKAKEKDQRETMEVEILEDIVVRRSGRRAKRHFCTKCKECFSSKVLLSEHACFGEKDRKVHAKSRDLRQARQVRSDKVDKKLQPRRSLHSLADCEDLNPAENTEDVDRWVEREEAGVKDGESPDTSVDGEAEVATNSLLLKEKELLPEVAQAEEKGNTTDSSNDEETRVVSKTEGTNQQLSEHENIEQYSIREITDTTNDSDNSTTNEKLLEEKVPEKKSSKESDLLSNLYCVHCHCDSCEEKVVCLHCIKVVTNLPKHLSKKHMSMPAHSIKIYSCQVDSVKSTFKDYMVFAKEPKTNTRIKDRRTEGYQYRCSKCGLLFGSVPSILKHLRLSHPKPMVCVCKSCGCGFLKTELFEVHKHFCRGGGVWGCRWCSEKFWRKKEFKVHLVNTHPQQEAEQLEAESEEDEVFDCSGMQEDLSLGSALSSFERITVSRDEAYTKMCLRCGPKCTASVARCNYCCQAVVTTDKLTHMRDVHPLIPTTSLWPVDCNHAYKTNSSAPEMLSQQVFVRGDTQKSTRVSSHVCALCSQEFDTPIVLKKHLSQDHKAPATCCDQCGLLIRSSWRILCKDHLSLCAGGDFVKCRQCGKLCGSYDSAKLHQMKSHTQQYNALRQARKRVSATAVETTNTNKASTITTSQGRHGDTILCVGCVKRCEGNKPVTCRLCLAVVEKDDDHMTLCHPYSPSDTWVITCRLLPDSQKAAVKFLIGRMIAESSDDTTVYKCEECDMVCLEMSQLMEHIQVHIDPSLHKHLHVCPHCQCVFLKHPEQSGAFEDHVQFCQSGELHTCQNCEQRFPSFKELCSHCEAMHKAGNDSSPVTYRDCDGEKISEDTQNGSKRPHSDLPESIAEYVGDGGEPLCVTCGNDCTNATDSLLCLYCFEVVQDIKQHRMKQHPFLPGDSLTAYSCIVNLVEHTGESPCIFTKGTHLKAVESGSELSDLFGGDPCGQRLPLVDLSVELRCSRCPLYTGSVEEMLSHVEGQHQEAGVQVCEGCGAGFVNEEYFRVHAYYCRGGRLRKCRVCSWLFWREGDWEKHVSLVHQDQQGGSVKDEAGEQVKSEQKRKRRRVNPGSSRQTSAPPGDPCAFQGSEYEVVPFVRTEDYTKVCFTCKESCTQEHVQCAYCNDIVEAGAKDQHMQGTHPLIPPSSLWPVRCKNKSMKGPGPDILSKQVFTSTLLESCPEFEEGTMQLTLTGYECAICDAEEVTGTQLKQHLKAAHQVDSVECPQCGMVIRSSCRVMVKDHLNLCGGGEFARCKLCGKLCGSIGSVQIHHVKIHANFNYQNSVVANLPRRSVGEVLQEEDGYRIVCVNCNDTCNTNKRPVRCMLCNVIVPKDAVHMKLRHPFSHGSTWYVTCHYHMFPEKPFYIGMKLNRDSDESSPEFHCIDCRADFHTHLELLTHIEQLHVVNTTHRGMKLKTCEFCEGVFKVTGETYGSFKDHIHFCGGGSLYKCDYCSEVFGFSLKLKRHLIKHHPKENSVVSSKSKGVMIAGRQYVKVERGMQPVEIPSGTLLRCAECQFSSYTYVELRKHNRSRHGYNLMQLNQLCRFCFMVFRKISEREKHEQSVHLGGMRFLCEECGSDFEIKSQLQHHIAYHHKGQREVIVERQKSQRHKQPIKVCPECGETFKLSFYYNQHIKMVHEKSLEYRCPLCGKQLSSKYKLKTHMDRHRGHKAFKCNYCSYTDYTRALVNLHIRKEHSQPRSQFTQLAVGKALTESLEVAGMEVGMEVITEGNAVEEAAEYVIKEEIGGQGVKVAQNFCVESPEGKVEGVTGEGVPVQYMYAVQYM